MAAHASFQLSPLTVTSDSDSDTVRILHQPFVRDHLRPPSFAFTPPGSASPLFHMALPPSRAKSSYDDDLIDAYAQPYEANRRHKSITLNTSASVRLRSTCFESLRLTHAYYYYLAPVFDHNRG